MEDIKLDYFADLDVRMGMGAGELGEGVTLTLIQ